MSTIPPQYKHCPQCRASVMDTSPVCPNCAFQFSAQPYAPPIEDAPNPNWQQPPTARYYRPGYQNPTGPADGMAIAGFIIGILSMFSVCVSCISMPLGAIAVVLSCVGLKGNNRGLAIAGIITGAIGLGGGILIIAGIFGGIFFARP